MPEELLDQAKKLALAQRQPVGNPFARAHNAEFNLENMPEREGVLRAVHDCYEGVFGRYKDPQPVVANRPKEYLDQPGRIAVNLLKLFVDLLSVSYDDPPERIYYRKGVRVDKADTVLTALKKINQAADYDRFMSMLDRWLHLFGNAVARPIYDTINGQLVYHCYPSYCVRVIENPINPRAPLATVLLGYEEEYGNDGLAKQIPTAEIWIDGEFIFIRDKDETQREDFADPTVNYEFVPLVHCFDSPPFGGKGRYFVNAMGWQLAQQNVRFNEDLIGQYIYAAIMQAIGILVVKGQVEGELIISPGRAVQFPNADDMSGLSSIAQNASLADFQSAIDFTLKLIRETYGIPESLLNADVQSSGAAIIQAAAPLAELRKHRQPIFARIETDLLRATLQELRGRAEGFPMNLVPMDWEIALQYPDPATNMAVTDEIAKDDHLVKLGVLTPAEILMREKPGQFDTIEEAEKFIEEHKPEPEMVAPDGQPVEDEESENSQIAVERKKEE